MKKLILLLLFSYFSITTVSAISYRGFADVSIGTFAIPAGGTEKENMFSLSISTTHGVQLNTHIYIGGGLSFIRASFDDGNWPIIIPIYANFRYDLNVIKKVSPFFSLKLGYNAIQSGLEDGIEIEKAKPLYLSPTIGLRVKLSSKCGINVGIGYNPIWYSYYPYGYMNDKEVKHNSNSGSIFGVISVDF